MDLEQELTDAMRRVRADLLKNEAQVKQSVILPILRALGWNTDAPEQLNAEFQAGNGRVDYALLNFGQPQVFIEAKRIGSAKDREAREQLFGYAENRGIPILVLTDGDHWDFYFGMGPGFWEERCFRRLVLEEDQKVSTYAEFLTAHLGRDAVISGNARRSADRLLEAEQALERAKQTLPDAWHALLMEPHQELRKLLMERVQAKCGVQPRAEDINSFLEESAIGVPRGRSEAISRADEPKTTPPVPEEHPPARKLRQGLKTPQREFTRLILQVLIEMGGRGKRKQVLGRVAQVMASRLGDLDRATLDNGAVRWVKTADWQCHKMRKDGLLEPACRRTPGLWEVSDQGRAYLSEQR